MTPPFTLTSVLVWMIYIHTPHPQELDKIPPSSFFFPVTDPVPWWRDKHNTAEVLRTSGQKKKSTRVSHEDRAISSSAMHLASPRGSGGLGGSLAKVSFTNTHVLPHPGGIYLLHPHSTSLTEELGS